MGYNEDEWFDDSPDFLSDFVGTVKLSFWDTPVGQALVDGREVPTFDNADRPQMYWQVTVDDITQEGWDKDQASIPVTFSIGGGWQLLENGTLVHEDDTAEKKRGFKPTSRYGQFLGLCFGREDEYKDIDKTDNVSKPVEYDMSSAAKFVRNEVGNPRDAEKWIGSQWRFRGLGTQMRNVRLRDVRIRPYPVAYLGTNGENGGGGSEGVQESGQESVGSLDPAVVAQLLPANTTPETVETLTKLIEVSNSHTAFLRQALVIPEVRSNDDLSKAISDEAGGPWKVK